MRCLDVGCGIGDVTLRMAQWVGPAGHAVGLDSDAAFLAAARQEATRRQLPALFRQGRAEDLDDEATYDLVYTRGLLTHVADPAEVVERMVRAACPGGCIVAEEPYFRARVCSPASPAFERCGELMQAAVQHHGGDPNIGPRVLGFFLDSGVQQVQLTGVLPLFYQGEEKRIVSITLEHVQEALTTAGLASPSDIETVVAELETFAQAPHTMLSQPMLVQVWGRKPSHSTTLPTRAGRGGQRPIVPQAKR
jgi:SAM-dependent methyltransferase